jgi:ubiquinone/menaquinone biosynthesis C-methylase UbiE
MEVPDEVRARVAAAYNHAADAYDHPANSFWNRFGARTVARLAIPPGARVLDLCCGSGASAIPAAIAAGPSGRVLAVDLAEGLVCLAKEKAERERLVNIEFRVGDVLALDPRAERFGYVVCVFGIFFIPDMTAALRHMWSLVEPGGRLAITTWGRGLFEPVNSYFWDAVRQRRPELYKSFDAWDRVGETRGMTAMFAEAGLPAAEVVLEPGTHELRGDNDVRALLMGTGYRGTMAQLSETERVEVENEVIRSVRSDAVAAITVDVIYATCPPPR